MQFWQEFKKFAVKGNMVDLAIGVIIGAAFNKIVDTLVKGIITPPLGYFTSGVDIADLKWVIRPTETSDSGEVILEGVVLNYGLFLQACLDFFIISMTIFLVIRFINSLRDRSEDETNKEVPTPKDIELLSKIHKEMKTMNSKMDAS